jgi:hypothetical protein
VVESHTYENEGKLRHEDFWIVFIADDSPGDFFGVIHLKKHSLSSEKKLAGDIWMADYKLNVKLWSVNCEARPS